MERNTWSSFSSSPREDLKPLVLHLPPTCIQGVLLRSPHREKAFGANQQAWGCGGSALGQWWCRVEQTRETNSKLQILVWLAMRAGLSLLPQVQGFRNFTSKEHLSWKSRCQRYSFRMDDPQLSQSLGVGRPGQTRAPAMPLWHPQVRLRPAQGTDPQESVQVLERSHWLL